MHRASRLILKGINPNEGEVSGSFSIEELTPEMEERSFEERAQFVADQLQKDLRVQMEETLGETNRYTAMNLVTRIDRFPKEEAIRVFLARHEDNLQLYKQVRNHVLGFPNTSRN
jgi:hypothetical protein